MSASQQFNLWGPQPEPPRKREFTARYYQREATEALLGSDGPALGVLATGLGKTEIFCMMAERLPGRGLVLAHNTELVEQARIRLEQRTEEMVGVEQAEFFSSGRERIVVGSMQTCAMAKRLRRLQILAGGFQWLIIDEAHRSICSSYTKIVAGFPDARLFGFTATPFRGDKRALGKVFPRIAYNMGIERGIEEGYLCQLKGSQISVDELDISQVSTTAGDLQKHQLDEAIVRAVEGIVQGLLKHHPDRRGPLFFPGKLSAALACERLNALRPSSAVLLTDDTEKDLRKSIKAKLKNPEVQWLCNVMVATEGFDWPDANMVGLARPTKSPVVHTQMIGRGTRVLPGTVDHLPERDDVEERHAAIEWSKKPDCIIVDFVGNCGKHEVRSLVDVMAGDWSPPEVAKAKELEREAKDPQDPRELLKRAKRELQTLARAVVAHNAKTTAVPFDLFRAVGIRPDPDMVMKYGYDPATPKQLAAIEHAGVPIPENLSKRDASRVLAKLNERREKGKCTPKQLEVLCRAGWESRNVSFAEASRMIDYLKTRNYNATVAELKAVQKAKL